MRSNWPSNVHKHVNVAPIDGMLNVCRTLLVSLNGPPGPTVTADAAALADMAIAVARVPTTSARLSLVNSYLLKRAGAAGVMDEFTQQPPIA